MCPLYFVFRKYLYSTASARPGPLTHCCCWGNTCLRCCKWSQLRVTTSNIAGQTYHASQLTECDGNIIGLYCGGPLILRLTLSISPSVCVNKPHQRFKQWNMLRGRCAGVFVFFCVSPDFTTSQNPVSNVSFSASVPGSANERSARASLCQWESRKQTTPICLTSWAVSTLAPCQSWTRPPSTLCILLKKSQLPYILKALVRFIDRKLAKHLTKGSFVSMSFYVSYNRLFRKTLSAYFRKSVITLSYVITIFISENEKS